MQVSTLPCVVLLAYVALTLNGWTRVVAQAAYGDVTNLDRPLTSSSQESMKQRQQAKPRSPFSRPKKVQFYPLKSSPTASPGKFDPGLSPQRDADHMSLEESRGSYGVQRNAGGKHSHPETTKTRGAGHNEGKIRNDVIAKNAPAGQEGPDRETHWYNDIGRIIGFEHRKKGGKTGDSALNSEQARDKVKAERVGVDAYAGPVKSKPRPHDAGSQEPPEDAELGLLTSHPHGRPRKHIFCYYGSFANSRPGAGKFWPEHIDPFLCTHLIFAFVDITADGTDIKPNNWNDLGENGLYRRTVDLKLKNPDLKVLLAVGGWKIGSKPFLPVIESAATWSVWISNVIVYLRRFGFDGLDMDWEFPGWRGSGPEDIHKFTEFMRDIYGAFAAEADETGRPRLLLTLATASSAFYVEKAYEPTEIHKYIDYMLLMTYNFHGSGWEKFTGHHTPLLPHHLDPEGEQKELNVLWAIKYWLNFGVPRSKLVMGMASYGLGWKLTDPEQTGVRAPADGGNTQGKYTEESGILSHYEICEHVIQDGWKVDWIDEQKVPYTYGAGEWVGFDSPDSFYIKAVTILQEGLAGAFVWSVEMDDFSGHCGGPKYPLLRTVYEVFTEHPLSQGSSPARLQLGATAGEHSHGAQARHSSAASRRHFGTVEPVGVAPGASRLGRVGHGVTGHSSGAASGHNIHGTPNHGTPNHGTPNHGTPNHGTPNHGTPNHGTPNHGTPNHGSQPSGSHARLTQVGQITGSHDSSQHLSKSPQSSDLHDGSNEYKYSELANNNYDHDYQHDYQHDPDADGHISKPWQANTEYDYEYYDWGHGDTSAVSAAASGHHSANQAVKSASKQDGLPKAHHSANLQHGPSHDDHDYYTETAHGDYRYKHDDDADGHLSKPWQAKSDYDYQYYDWDDTSSASASSHYVESEDLHHDSSHTEGVDCDVLGLGIHSAPHSCRHFILCVPITGNNLGPSLMTCPKGTLYDDTLKVCNHQHMVDCDR